MNAFTMTVAALSRTFISGHAYNYEFCTLRAAKSTVELGEKPTKFHSKVQTDERGYGSGDVLRQGYDVRLVIRSSPPCWSTAGTSRPAVVWWAGGGRPPRCCPGSPPPASSEPPADTQALHSGRNNAVHWDHIKIFLFWVVAATLRNFLWHCGKRRRITWAVWCKESDHLCVLASVYN